MLVQHMLRGRGGVGVDGQGQNRHLCHFFQHDRVVDRLCRILAPSKGAVAGAEHTGHMHGVNAALGKGFQNHLAGILLVVLIDFFRGQFPCAGDRAVEVIGVGGAKGGQVSPGLGKGHRMGGVGMYDAAQLGECFV